MSELQRVSMNLTETDIENAEKLKKTLNTRTNAAAVSTALSLAAQIAEQLKNGGRLTIEDKSGRSRELFIPGL